ncbi:MAG: iron-sulfur cluster assembly accessory protein [Verrucomicrobiae bacterium]|nr:iron-sulfur cluster assembly accessory protein [Verrucomicrobiae bacterium]
MSHHPSPHSSLPTYEGVQYRVGNDKFLTVSPNAAKRLSGILERQGKSEKGAMRIAVVGGGCSGLSYKMDIVEGPRDRDIFIQSNGVRVVVDPKTALFVSGAELDYSDDLQQGGFKVHNPNAKSTCSCGESFSV